MADFAFAQRDLEVPLPQVGEESAITETPLLPAYVKYVFNFGIGIAGLIAFLMLVYGGFRYLTSAGNPSAMSDANSQIFAGLIGLIVILGSWLLLTTINPQLININPQLSEEKLVVGSGPGVYLCSDNTDESCQSFTSSKDNLGTLNNEVQRVKFKNIDDIVYGVVLHEDKYYEGNCAVCLSDGCQAGIEAIGGNGPSSITIFLQGGRASGSGVTVYRHQDYNEGKDKTKDYYAFSVGGYNDLNEYVFVGTNIDLDGEISSIKVEDDYLAILFDGKNYTGQCSVFKNNDPSFRDDAIKDNQASSLKILLGK